MMTSLAAVARDLGTGRWIQWSRSMLIDFADGATARMVHSADEVMAQEWGRTEWWERKEWSTANYAPTCLSTSMNELTEHEAIILSII